MKKGQESIDFLSNLISPYCSKTQLDCFVDHFYDKPIKGLIKNTYVNEDGDFFLRCEKDEKDDILYRYDEDKLRAGKTINHFAGSFYILDPSSVLPSFYLAGLLKENFTCLDLAAAPGGKSFSLAFRRKDGLFLLNDISYKRNLETVKNIERLSLLNTITSSIDPCNIDEKLKFDCVILDAPCSSSGMFRKEEKMLEDLSNDKINRLLPIQATLLEKAYNLLNLGGYLLYSTCSLSTLEDEEQVERFLNNHKDMKLLSFDVDDNVLNGVNKIGYHLVPSIYTGEGIYFAILKKEGNSTETIKLLNTKNDFNSPLKIKKDKQEYIVSNFSNEFYRLPLLSIGMKKYSFEQYKKCDFDHSYSKCRNEFDNIELNKKDAIDYTCGSEIKTTSNLKDGLVVLTYNGLKLGFGKKTGNRIKNYLPKGLREIVIE